MVLFWEFSFEPFLSWLLGGQWEWVGETRKMGIFYNESSIDGIVSFLALLCIDLVGFLLVVIDKRMVSAEAVFVLCCGPVSQ